MRGPGYLVLAVHDIVVQIASLACNYKQNNATIVSHVLYGWFYVVELLLYLFAMPQ